VLLICPLLVWAAMRFRQAGAALVALEVSVIASAAAAAHDNAFARGSILHSMLMLQVFNASVALTGLLLAAAISQLDDSRRDLSLANTLLSERFEQRGAQIDHDRSRIAVLAHRHQLATQLHDTVLQRLFGVGTALDAAAAAMDEDGKNRLARLVDDLDGTINDLAVAIFQADVDGAEFSFGDAVGHVIAAGSQPSMRAATLSVGGDGDDIPLALRPQILAALQESLIDMTAAAVHAQVSVALTISKEEVCILIVCEHSDTSSGPQEGIRRAQARAHRLGGSCKWQTTADGSTFELRFPTGPSAWTS
jgi:signal transduction histidine kinase